jgi:amidophosphoribosyltransferase
MPSVNELIAHGRTDEEIAKEIGADWLVYQDLHDLIAASGEGNPEVPKFDCAVFDGKYVTGDVDEAYLARLDAARNDLAQANDYTDDHEMVGIQNS